MKFLADEGVDKSVVDGLRLLGYDVFYVAEEIPATDDETLLSKADSESRIVITRDKDFGELIYRLHKAHSGIILVRLDEYDTITRGLITCKLIEQYSTLLPNAFSVIQKGVIRIREQGK